MLEIEERFKINLEEKKKIEKKIFFLGAKTEFSGIVEDFVFIKKPFGHYYARIRIKKEGPKLDIKIHQGNNFKEIETDISDPRAVAEMLKLFGLEPHLWIKRFREVYEVVFDNKKFEITFDDLENVGKFIEISFLSDSENCGDCISRIKKKLNIKKKSQDTYGTIIKRKLMVDKVFRRIYKRRMRERFENVLAN